MKEVYYILSGEGEFGTWERVVATSRGIKRRLAKERCGGDRFARAFECTFRGDVVSVMENIESDETRLVSSEVVQ